MDQWDWAFLITVLGFAVALYGLLGLLNGWWPF